MKRNAFTLVELLVVISIISLLAALLLPGLAQSMRDARQLQCLNQCHQVGIASTAFAQDNRDRLPAGPPVSPYLFGVETVWQSVRGYMGVGPLVKNKYMEDSRALYCPLWDSPATGGPGPNFWEYDGIDGWKNNGAIGYIAIPYVYRSTFGTTTSPRPARMSVDTSRSAIFADMWFQYMKFYHHRTNYSCLYLDGSARTIDDQKNTIAAAAASVNNISYAALEACWKSRFDR